MTVLRGGLLVEGARTNLALHSADFGNAYWVKAASSVTTDQAVAPDGATAGDRLIEDNTNATHSIQTGTVTVVNGSTYTFSVWVKANGRGFVRLSRAGGAVGSSFNLATGAVLDASGSTGRATIFPSGWVRCSIAFATVSTSVSMFVELQQTASTSAQAYTGDNTSGVFLWGAQLELGSFASTYVPTVASTVTRATDQVSYANFPQPAEIAARGGITVYSAHVDLGTRDAASGATWRYFQVGDGAAASTNRLLRSVADAGASSQLGNGSTFVTAALTVNPARMSYVERLHDIEYRLNGATPEFRLRVRQWIGGTESGSTAFTGWLDATALIANGWQGSPTLYVGARDGGNNAGFALHQQLKTAFGVQTIDYMRGLV
jgi:hypothetical protein